MPPPPAADDELADLVAACIVAYERDGQDAVDGMLAQHARLADAARAQLASLRDAGLLVPPRRPERIGRYRVRQLLGSGGMGEVWLCDQDEPMRRRVAVKLIRAGMNQGDVLRRFRLEQQALALLEHPHIARVFDAGATDDGQPFLVMEYVPGLPMTRYCDERQLDLRARLQLFARVCEAVQHAHQRGILHRDLKPSNVLVTDRDGAPFPVVIDFGVAKAVGGALATATLLTLPGRQVGTPEYMSPEQATNDQDVDTRTDVFSLGVLLYELLTGTLPIDSARLQRSPDLAQALLAHDPPTPSTRLASLGGDARRIAEQRRVDVQTLARMLRGDLDWIVLKAIERDRNRRYGMVGELAADVRRHLHDEPVLAARPGRWYSTVKFCRRHRLQVAAATAVFAALTAGLVVSTTFYREAAAAERNARNLASRLHGSLDTTLAAVDRIVALGADGMQALPQSGSMRAQLIEEALELHQRLIASGDPSDPRLAASLASAQARAANLQYLLGRQEAAHDLLQRAERTLATAPLDAAADSTQRCQRALACHLCGELRLRRGEPEESRRLAQQALTIYDSVLADAPEHRAARLGRLLALRELADRATATDIELARRLMRDALPLADRFLTSPEATLEEHVAGLWVWIRLGWLEGETGQLAAGQALTRRADDFLHRTIAATTEAFPRRELARLLPSLANSQVRFADYDAARATVRLAIAELRPAIAANPELGSYRTALAASLFTLAMLQGDREPYEDVDRLQREALALEDDAYERSGRSADRGDRYLGYLLSYAADRVDLLLEHAAGNQAIDRPFLHRCLQRAEQLHEALPEVFLRDRHTRESWCQSYLVRAGLQQLDGDFAGARRTLADGRRDVAGLQREFPTVVQAHRVATNFAFVQSHLEQRAGDAERAWAFAAEGCTEFARILALDPASGTHWSRLRPMLAAAVVDLAKCPPPSTLGAAALADLAMACAGCAAAGGDQHPTTNAELLAFGKQAFAAACSRGLPAERRDRPEFEPLRR